MFVPKSTTMKRCRTENSELKWKTLINRAIHEDHQAALLAKKQKTPFPHNEMSHLVLSVHETLLQHSHGYVWGNWWLVHWLTAMFLVFYTDMTAGWKHGACQGAGRLTEEKAELKTEWTCRPHPQSKGNKTSLSQSRRQLLTTRLESLQNPYWSHTAGKISIEHITNFLSTYICSSTNCSGVILAQISLLHITYGPLWLMSLASVGWMGRYRHLVRISSH